MRKSVILILLVAMAVPGFGAKRVSVESFERSLGAMHGKRDADLAKRIREMELTERLSDARFAQLEIEMPGPLARQALVALADASAFLDLPVAETPVAPVPDRGAQDAMLMKAFDYASHTIPRLPNFFATRETTRFEDMPSEPHQSPTEFSVSVPLHFVGTSSETVLYRNGNEIVDASGQSGETHELPVFGLSTSGTFGPILATVLADASRGKLAWARWERGPDGMRAVYRFSVPEQASHYTVTFPGLGSDDQRVPAYHGEMEINSADGTVLRLAMVAELDPAGPVSEAGIMVQYGPVQIGGRTYICPVKSVARSVVRTVHPKSATRQDIPNVVWDSGSVAGLREVPKKDEDTSPGALQLRVNEVLFKNYHLFRAEARILGAEVQGPEENQPAVTPAGTGSQTPLSH